MIKYILMLCILIGCSKNPTASTYTGIPKPYNLYAVECDSSIEFYYQSDYYDASVWHKLQYYHWINDQWLNAPGIDSSSMPIVYDYNNPFWLSHQFLQEFRITAVNQYTINPSTETLIIDVGNPTIPCH